MRKTTPVNDDERVLSILIKAQDLLKNEVAWTKGTWARRADGTACSAMDPAAVCWCAEGALTAASHAIFPDSRSYYNDRARARLREVIHREIHEWNDMKSRKHRGVMLAFSLAIKATRGGQNENE